MADAPLKRLPVDVSELCIALDAEPGDIRWYLDLGTGEVLLVTREYRPADHDGLTVGDIDGAPERFLRVPGCAGNGLDDMRAFAFEVADERLRESLLLALEAPRPDRRFRAVLGWLPEQQQCWHDFRQARAARRALAWLESLGFTPAEGVA